ncbi:hypothetical protein REPUB_Repub03eG0155700 [Reevesia pubescens]
MFGEVKEVFIPRKRRSVGKVFGFVKFHYERDAASAIQNLNGRVISSHILSLNLAKYDRQKKHIFSNKTLESRKGESKGRTVESPVSANICVGAFNPSCISWLQCSIVVITEKANTIPGIMIKLQDLKVDFCKVRKIGEMIFLITLWNSEQDWGDVLKVDYDINIVNELHEMVVSVFSFDSRLIKGHILYKLDHGLIPVSFEDFQIPDLKSSTVESSSNNSFSTAKVSVQPALVEERSAVKTFPQLAAKQVDNLISPYAPIKEFFSNSTANLNSCDGPLDHIALETTLDKPKQLSFPPFVFKDKPSKKESGPSVLPGFEDIGKLLKDCSIIKENSSLFLGNLCHSNKKKLKSNRERASKPEQHKKSFCSTRKKKP